MNKKNTNTLQKSILNTLAYYKALKTPLTLVQLGRYLISENSHTPAAEGGHPSLEGTDSMLSEIKEILDELAEQGTVKEQKGLYWLASSCNFNADPSTPLRYAPSYAYASARLAEADGEAQAGRQDDRKVDRQDDKTWGKYIQREKVAQQKINKVRKTLKILASVPFLRGIFICGSVARKVCQTQSDIDFLILTSKNRVWTVRFFLTILAFILGKKTPRSGQRKDKFCLNHYRSSSNLKLEENLRDLYSAMEYSRMINVYSTNRIERKFFKKNKIWMRKFLSSFNYTKLPLYNVETGHAPSLQKSLENMLPGKIGNIIEKLLLLIQSKKIAFGRNSIPARPAGGYAVPRGNRRIVTDNEVIMFHLSPRAPEILNRYQKTCQKLALQ